MERDKTGTNWDDLPPDAFPLREDAATELLASLQRLLGGNSANTMFKLPSETADQSKLDTPKLGLPRDCAVRPSFNILVLKPQLAFRSEAEPNAIILLAVEEAQIKGFAVEDLAAKDDIAADVLGRYGCSSVYDFADVQNLCLGQGSPSVLSYGGSFATRT
jgi:hypothetical protein